MPDTPTTTQSLRRVFMDGFVARDLAEPLASLDISTDIADVRQFFDRRSPSVIGVRSEGVIAGVIQRESLKDCPLADQLENPDKAVCVVTTTSLQQVVQILDHHPYVLVYTLGQPIGFIVRADLEKPPMRMWLFGMISLFEMSITKIIEIHLPNEVWRELISQTRVEKAEVLQAERKRRNQSVSLLDSLQLSDKGQIVAKSDEIREIYWNRSRNEIRRVVKELEKLRNNLAHSQPFTNENWGTIQILAGTLDRLLEIPAKVMERNSQVAKESV